MGNVIVVPKANGQARLNRETFFASGATIDHGDHQHEFRIQGEQAIVRNLQMQDNGETVVTNSEQTMSRDEAFAEYELLLRAPLIGARLQAWAFLMAFGEMLAEENQQFDDEEVGIDADLVDLFVSDSDSDSAATSPTASPRGSSVAASSSTASPTASDDEIDEEENYSTGHSI